jgi:hypothetical protein
MHSLKAARTERGDSNPSFALPGVLAGGLRFEVSIRGTHIFSTRVTGWGLAMIMATACLLRAPQACGEATFKHVWERSGCN